MAIAWDGHTIVEPNSQRVRNIPSLMPGKRVQGKEEQASQSCRCKIKAPILFYLFIIITQFVINDGGVVANARTIAQNGHHGLYNDLLIKVPKGQKPYKFPPPSCCMKVDPKVQRRVGYNPVYAWIMGVKGVCVFI